jgi:nitrite reductase/ring-hydroxylating ferredoxin subunit
MSGDFTLALNYDQLEENGIKLLNLNNISLVVVKYKGEVFSLNSRCPHMGCSLAKGTVKDYFLSCPCHGWSFDIRTGEYKVNKNIKLETYQTKVENGNIFVKAVSEF